MLVSQGLDHVMRPLAQYLGVSRLVSNRLEFRNGVATGRLLDPVIRPRSPIARAFERSADGRVPCGSPAEKSGPDRAIPSELQKAILACGAPQDRRSPGAGRL